MNHSLENGSFVMQAPIALPEFNKDKGDFRRQFKRSLSQCVNHGFSVEECFGMIWEEVLEEIELSECAQSQLYEELIAWARRWVV